MIASFLISILPTEGTDVEQVTLELNVDDEDGTVSLEVQEDSESFGVNLSEAELDQLGSAVTMAKSRLVAVRNRRAGRPS